MGEKLGIQKLMILRGTRTVAAVGNRLVYVYGGKNGPGFFFSLLFFLRKKVVGG